jgi:hypothetical protein
LAATGSVAVTNQVTVTTTGTLPVAVQGQVGVNNFPAVQAVSGSVSVHTQGPQDVTGTVNLGNWPPVIAVSGSQPSGSTHAGFPVVVGGVYTSGSYIKSLYVDVSGAIYVTTSGSLPVTGGIQVLNQVTVTGSVLSLPSGVQQVSGSLAVDNVVRVTTTGSLPVHVDSQVSINNFPATQNVSGSISTYTQGPQLVSGTISVTGSVSVYTTSPQSVTGSVAVYTQGPQAVSGTVGVNNFPIVQAVSGSQLSGSTFAGSPVTVGGVTSGSNRLVQAVQVDVSGAIYITTTGSLPVVGATMSGSTARGNPVLTAGVDSNSVVRSLLTDEQGRIVTAPAGASADKGFSDGKVVLASTTVTAIRSTTYTEQSTNAQRSVVSTSASDSSTGTGARKVKITYYDQNVNGPFTETVTLNGTTAVNTVATNICYIERIEVITVGSTGSNVGTINLKATINGGGITVWSIAATENRTFGAHHYVPAGKSAFITGFTAGIKGADTTGAIIRSIPIPTGSNAEVQISDLLRVPSSGQSSRTYGTPIEVSGSARFTAFAVPDSTSSRTYYGSIDFYEE